MATSNWTLYVKTLCPWCIKAQNYLHSHGYDYHEVNVSSDAQAFAKMQQLSGQRLTPTLVIESTGQILPDFDVDQLETFLKENGLFKEAA